MTIDVNPLVRREAQASMPTVYGEFMLIAYSSPSDDLEHLALVRGRLDENEATLVRVHSECLTGDVFGSQRCDCGQQLDAALRMVAERDRGVILYMRQEGRGIGLVNKVRAYQLQDAGQDTVEANEALGFQDDLRDYAIGASILLDLGVRHIELMTNNPRKVLGLKREGLTIVRRVPLQTLATERNIRYLRTKRDKMGHDLKLDAQAAPS